MWGALSDKWTGLSFTIAAGARQRRHSRVRVPWDSRTYFTVSDLRLPFSLTPTTRRATVEVFGPASTREDPRLDLGFLLYNVGTDRQKTHFISVSTEMFVDHPYPMSAEIHPVAGWFPRIHLHGNVFAVSSLAMGLHITILCHDA
jgi:hypothetical protein